MKQGDPTTEIEYDDDPVERAKAFVDAGAQRLARDRSRRRLRFRRKSRSGRANLQSGQRAGSDRRRSARRQARRRRFRRRRVGDHYRHAAGRGRTARAKHRQSLCWAESSPESTPAVRKLLRTAGRSTLRSTAMRSFVASRNGASRASSSPRFDVTGWARATISRRLCAVANAAEVKVTASGGARNIDDLHELGLPFP